MALLDDIVIEDGNREGFELILDAPRRRDTPLNALVYGPVGCGKTTMAQARAKTPDLMSGKHMSLCHSTELVAFFNLGEMGERFLENAGSVEVLLLDGFQDFFSEEIGPQLCKLLLQARISQGFDTILISDESPEELAQKHDMSELVSVLDNFEMVEVSPLSRDGLLEFVNKMAASYGAGSRDIEFADDAAAYIVDEFCQTPQDIRNAVRFLVNPATFDDGTVIDAALAAKALNE